MNKQNIKTFIDGWLLPPKLKVNGQILRDKIYNRLTYGTKDFEKMKCLETSIQEIAVLS